MTTPTPSIQINGYITPEQRAQAVLAPLIKEVLRQVSNDLGPLQVIHHDGWARWFLDAQEEAAHALPGITLRRLPARSPEPITDYSVSITNVPGKPPSCLTNGAFAHDYVFFLQGDTVFLSEDSPARERVRSLRQARHALKRALAGGVW